MKHIEKYNEVSKNYKMLHKASVVLAQPSAPILGRDNEELRRGLRNPEKANILLLADPGTGKTAYIQGFAYDKASLQHYLVLEVNLELLITTGEDKETSLLKGFSQLVDEAGSYSKAHNVIVVLFIDEFHKIAQLSPALVESIKPKLEKSAVNNFRLIAATTYSEYNEWLAGNRAFDQRFLHIKIPELPKEAVLKILEGRAKKQKVYELLEPGILESIYEESKRILISNAQPRASIDILQSMVGETVKHEYMSGGQLHRQFYTAEEMGLPGKYTMSRPVLNRIIQRTHGIDIDNKVDVNEVVSALRARLFNQDQAIDTIVSYLEMASLNFNDLDRPKISFLSTGSTGVGKACANDTLVPIYNPSGQSTYKRHGDIKVGDYVFNREGKPVQVTGVYPQGELDAYEVVFMNDARVVCNDEHLWTYKQRNGNGSKTWKTDTLKHIMSKKLTTQKNDGRTSYNYVIPHSEGLQQAAYDVNIYVDPYVMGAMLGNGLMGESMLSFSSDDEETVSRIAKLLNAKGYKRGLKNYTWVFELDGSSRGQGLVRIQTKDVFASIPDIINTKSHTKFIPEIYKGGSIEQRWSLIQGLFDTDGSIDNRYKLSYSTASKQLALDIKFVLSTLGVSSTVVTYDRGTKGVEHRVIPKVQNSTKVKFFRLSRKLERAIESQTVVKHRVKKYKTLQIKKITPLNMKTEMTCIMVDDDEHLYQITKDHVVTHNTELAKIITETMRIPLKRFDMSRYSDPKDAGAFADDLFLAAWSTPNAYILIDEVEKSSREAMNILLQVLDDARLTDSKDADRVASFSGTIINLTTNLGSEVYQAMNAHQGNTAVVDTDLIYKSLSDSNVFETAVLGRIDAIVPFRPLPAETLQKIAVKTLNNIIALAETNKRRIIVSDDVIPYLVKDRTSNDTERGGARDAKRVVKNLVVKELAHYLTTTKKEVPIIIYIKGKPRFKHKEIADPLNAHVAIKECHPIEQSNKVLDVVSKKIGKPLENDGFYIPLDTDLQTCMRDILVLSTQGSLKIRTVVDGESVVFKGDK